MAISITLTLPDEIFSLAQSLAHSINRDLNDILVEAIAFSISPNYQGDITPTGGGPVSTPEPRGIVSLIAVGALGAASLRRRG